VENTPAVQKQDADFTAAVLKHISYGGGVFLMPYTMNVHRQVLHGLTEALGVAIPVEAIVERDPAKTSVLRHAPSVPIAYTSNVFPSAVSGNVSGIWYPLENCAYCNSHMGGPVLFRDAAWTTVFSASHTAITRPINWNFTGQAPPPDPIVRVPGVTAPALFGIRDVSSKENPVSGGGGKAGRVSLMNMWQQFHVGGGSKWIMNNQVRTTRTNPYQFLLIPATRVIRNNPHSGAGEWGWSKTI
jgi:hypothetical protein